MKQWITLLSICVVIAAFGLLSGCDHNNDNVTQSSGMVDALSFTKEAGAAPEQSPLPPHRPPQEAFEACEGKNEGDMASLTTPQGDTVNGTCQMIEGELVLVPENAPGDGPPQGEHQPPQEAVSACENLNEGASCEVVTPHGDIIAGTCQALQDLLACVPNDRPQGPPPGGAPPEGNAP